ncbi:MAG: DUF1801 domain-containing protein [Euryarchaeota archaeon]|nr:DUF1801 domain-containing protein [Euryarchaeota archaeon]
MTKVLFRNVDEYIASFPKGIQATLRQVRRAIRDAVPKAEEVIRYHMPTYRFHGPLASFAVFKEHYSLFGVRRADFKKELPPYEGTGRGTVRFPFDAPVPVRLIATIARHRAKENLRAPAKR